MRISVLIILGFIIQPILSQNVQFEVMGTHEERSTEFSNKIILNLRLKNILVDENHWFRIGSVMDARDDLGNSLYKIDDYFSDQFTIDSIIDLTLTAPPRYASEIRLVEGDIIYFTPAENKNSLVHFPSIAQISNKKILTDEIHGIEMYLLDRKEFEELQITDLDEFYRQKTKLVQENKFTNSELEELKNLIYIYQDALDYLEDDLNTLNFYLSDPAEQIVDIQFFTSEGDYLSYSSFRSNQITSLSFFETPEDYWSMTILIANSQSISYIPFQLKNIKLP